MNKLTDEQIKQRLQEGRNYKRLYLELKVKYDALQAENKALRDENLRLKQQLETQAIQIAELQTMVFGKKSKPPSSGSQAPDPPKPEPKPRGKGSYRRPTPPASAITSEETVSLPESCVCGGTFGSVTTHERYTEDIPLPELTQDYHARLVTRYTVERGVCGDCGKPAAGTDLGGQKTTLGPNVRLLICHLVTVVGLSYARVANLLLSLYGLNVSDGEISGSLADKHRQWLPAYERLKADTRASPVKHFDETPWKITDADNMGHAWVMSAAGSPDTVFHLATSRGGRHAGDLHGGSSGIHVTDDYGPYRNLSGQQQLCWAHLYRCIRDLEHNQHLPEEQQPYVKEWYETFAGIYRDVREYLDEPYDQAARAHQSDELWQRVQALAQQPAPAAGEPHRLARLKAQLMRAGQARLFTCLTSDAPCDNNRAERDLRPLVLKRRRSFGSKSEKGAQALSTVMSICTTTWKSNPDNYFQALAAV